MYISHEKEGIQNTTQQKQRYIHRHTHTHTRNIITDTTNKYTQGEERKHISKQVATYYNYKLQCH